jgi:hypothetical protein
VGLSLVRGREFGGEGEPDECRIAVINREAADLYFGGKGVGSAVIDYQGVRTMVVGVVNSRTLGDFQRQAAPAVYFPMAQEYPLRMTLIAGGGKPTQPMLRDLGQAIEALPGSGKGPVVIKTLAEHLAHTALAPLRIAAVIVGASASTAFALSLLGLFSALRDAAQQRRRELAIRIALGAARWRVICQVLSEGGRLACAGVLLSAVGSLALSRFLSTIVSIKTGPAWWIWLAAPGALALAVVIASVIPARRGLMMSPLTIMREDNS